MLTKVTRRYVSLVGSLLWWAIWLGPSAAYTQDTGLANGLKRLAGTDSSSHIEYVRLFLDGKLLSSTAGAPPPDPSPALTAQCTSSPNGKMAFELFANFGGIDDLAFYPPWRPSGPDDIFPPRTQKLKMTMEFLGYMHAKPVRREWEAVLQPFGQFRYNPPSTGSNNLEDSTYYLRFLLALPTVRLTLGERSAEFQTAPLLEQIRKEPLCKASLL